MAAGATRGVEIPGLVLSIAEEPVRRRRIDSRAHRALRTLAHAIAYLSANPASVGSFHSNRERIEAVQVLMGLNRQVYMECPEAPKLRERWRALFWGRK